MLGGLPPPRDRGYDQTFVRRWLQVHLGMYRLRDRIQKTLKVHWPSKAHLRILQVQTGADKANTSYRCTIRVSTISQSTFSTDQERSPRELPPGGDGVDCQSVQRTEGKGLFDEYSHSHDRIGRYSRRGRNYPWRCSGRRWAWCSFTDSGLPKLDRRMTPISNFGSALRCKVLRRQKHK